VPHQCRHHEHNHGRMDAAYSTRIALSPMYEPDSFTAATTALSASPPNSMKAQPRNSPSLIIKQIFKTTPQPSKCDTTSFSATVSGRRPTKTVLRPSGLSDGLIARRCRSPPFAFTGSAIATWARRPAIICPSMTSDAWASAGVEKLMKPVPQNLPVSHSVTQSIEAIDPNLPNASHTISSLMSDEQLPSKTRTFCCPTWFCCTCSSSTRSAEPDSDMPLIVDIILQSGMFVRLFVVLFVAHCAADSVPLITEQATALLELYVSLGCAGDGQNCPFVSTVCPALERAEYGERLACNNGYVTAVTISGENTTTNGTLPTTIGRLSMLTSLLIYNTYLTTSIQGTLPESLFNLTRLTALELCCGALSGTLSPSFGRLTALRELGLHFNQFNGTIPSAMSRMTSLRVVRVDNNKLSGVAPAFPSIADPHEKCSLSVDFAPYIDTNCFSACEQPSCCRSNRSFCSFPFAPSPTPSSTSNAPTTSIEMATTPEGSTSPLSSSASISMSTVDVPAASPHSGVVSAAPPIDDNVIGAIVGGILALLVIVPLASILIRRWRRWHSSMATTQRHAHTTQTYSVLPAPDRTYDDVKDVRGTGNEYEATDTPLRA
jgi:hypothetical protein